MIEWHYVKDAPIPKDGRRVFLADRDPRTGDIDIMTFHCVYCSGVTVYDKPKEYYAWADFNVVPPPYPGEEAKDVAV